MRAGESGTARLARDRVNQVRIAMLSIRSFAWLATLVLVTLDVCAAPPVTGFYIGAGAGQSRYDMDFGSQVQAAYADSPFAVTGASMGRTHDTAYRVFGGYQFSPYVAIEGGWQDLGSVNGNYELTNTHGDTFSRSAEWSLSGFNATLVGMYPFAERFAVIGKVGAFFSKLEFSERTTSSGGDRSTFNGPNDNDVRLMWGVGGSYQLTERIGLRLDWDRIESVGRTFALTEDGNGKFNHVDMWSASLIWRF
jgi:OOP family OmpA-OmpF porin